MKFKSSVAETRCNDLWNNYVVTLDQIITSKLRCQGFFSSAEISGLILLYVDLVKSVISNVERHHKAEPYDDSSYVSSYIHSTVANCLEDLQGYKSKAPALEQMLNPLIVNIGQKLDSVITEYGMRAPR